jgi:hypothetical protein
MGKVIAGGIVRLLGDFSAVRAGTGVNRSDTGSRSNLSGSAEDIVITGSKLLALHCQEGTPHFHLLAAGPPLAK